MKLYKPPKSDKTQRPFGKSMPCEQVLRVPMHRHFIAAICVAHATLDWQKHDCSTFSLLLLSISYEQLSGSRILHRLSPLSPRPASHILQLSRRQPHEFELLSLLGNRVNVCIGPICSPLIIRSGGCCVHSCGLARKLAACSFTSAKIRLLIWP